MWEADRKSSQHLQSRERGELEGREAGVRTELETWAQSGEASWRREGSVCSPGALLTALPAASVVTEAREDSTPQRSGRSPPVPSR